MGVSNEHAGTYTTFFRYEHTRPYGVHLSFIFLPHLKKLIKIQPNLLYEEILLPKLSVSEIYGISASVYRENFLKLLIPVIIPVILLVGVSLIFYISTLPTLIIDDIAQYYTFSSYQALEQILGTWYYIFIGVIAVYIVMNIYSVSAIVGVISEGLATGSLSLDEGARSGVRGFVHSVIPIAVLLVLTYYMLTSYGRYSLIVTFILTYIGVYTISASVVGHAVIIKNIAFSIRDVVRAPLFSMVVFVVPAAMVLLAGGVVLRLSITYLPEFVLVTTPIAMMIVIPYASIINAIAYLSLRQ